MIMRSIVLFFAFPLFFPFYAFVPVAALAFSRDTNLAEVKRAFDVALISGNINLIFEPQILLEVTFPQPSTNTKPITLRRAGAQLLVNETTRPPIFNIIKSRSKGPFFIAIVDPDAPTPQKPIWAQIRHFLGGDFFLETPRIPTLLSNNTEALSPFLQPVPPAGSDPHRFVFLIFDQPRDFRGEKLATTNDSLIHFIISSYASAMKLGQPIGGTFMLVGS
ncbi:hypothetical protein HYPSUDRAFT_374473 [Hypholoma sublateritium FD-334 SS-4]|uniref:PEBP-like protein n=1 Tax=Hypholoma sublateritium (strain FD-334 SS-4) TaxID=945553 RepID=A0A0D2LE43_HYPSF|nr:hypothetical protein HYPSUDRAFT_374473 [Hypholoma sublateritium FD-334 SS-4]